MLSIVQIAIFPVVGIFVKRCFQECAFANSSHTIRNDNLDQLAAFVESKCSDIKETVGHIDACQTCASVKSTVAYTLYTARNRHGL